MIFRPPRPANCSTAAGRGATPAGRMPATPAAHCQAATAAMPGTKPLPAAPPHHACWPGICHACCAPSGRWPACCWYEPLCPASLAWPVGAAAATTIVHRTVAAEPPALHLRRFLPAQRHTPAARTHSAAPMQLPALQKRSLPARKAGSPRPDVVPDAASASSRGRAPSG